MYRAASQPSPGQKESSTSLTPFTARKSASPTPFAHSRTSAIFVLSNGYWMNRVMAAADEARMR